MTSPADVVRGFFEALEARDWDAARGLLAAGVVVDWPATGERFRGAERFIAMQRAYPEGWRIRVLRVVAAGDEVAAEVAVDHGADTFVCCSFARVEAGRIVTARETWATFAADEPPAWRAAYAQRDAERP